MFNFRRHQPAEDSNSRKKIEGVSLAAGKPNGQPSGVGRGSTKRRWPIRAAAAECKKKMKSMAPEKRPRSGVLAMRFLPSAEFGYRAWVVNGGKWQSMEEGHPLSFQSSAGRSKSYYWAGRDIRDGRGEGASCIDQFVEKHNLPKNCFFEKVTMGEGQSYCLLNAIILRKDKQLFQDGDVVVAYYGKQGQVCAFDKTQAVEKGGSIPKAAVSSMARVSKDQSFVSPAPRRRQRRMSAPQCAAFLAADSPLVRRAICESSPASQFVLRELRNNRKNIGPSMRRLESSHLLQAAVGGTSSDTTLANSAGNTARIPWETYCEKHGRGGSHLTYWRYHDQENSVDYLSRSHEAKFEDALGGSATIFCNNFPGASVPRGVHEMTVKCLLPYQLQRQQSVLQQQAEAAAEGPGLSLRS